MNKANKEIYLTEKKEEFNFYVRKRSWDIYRKKSLEDIEKSTSKRKGDAVIEI